MANLNKIKKHHFIYKTTNLLNGKYYVGMHSTNNLKDGYLGSGKRLRYSIRKYGIENFKLDILEWFDSRQALVERETQLVNEDLLKDEMCMNLKTGGNGGFCNDEHARKFHLAGVKKMNEIVWQRDTHREMHSNRMKKLWEDGVLKQNAWPKGKPLSDETKSKISKIKKGTGIGSSNSQFGTCWITNGTDNKKIYKGDLVPAGWYLGRK